MIQFIDFMLGEIQKALEAHKREPIKKVPNKIPNKVPDKLLRLSLKFRVWHGASTCR